MNKKNKLDKFHYHEALDRIYLMNSLFDEFINEHPVIQNHQLLKEKCDKISNNLADVYQLIGNIKVLDK